MISNVFRQLLKVWTTYIGPSLVQHMPINVLKQPIIVWTTYIGQAFLQLMISNVFHTSAESVDNIR